MKSKKTLYLIIIALLSFLMIGISYAFFNTIINGNSNAKDVVVETGTLKLTYIDGPAIDVQNIKPGWSTTKVVTIKNTGTLDTAYNIIWQELTNTILKNELVIEATCKRLNGNGLEEGSCETIDELPVRAKTILKNISIEAGFTHEYTFTIFFKDTGTNQNYNMKKTFEGKLGIEEYKDTAVYCTYDGELTQGAEYVNGQYTYRYKQEFTSSGWNNITEDGWGVILTDAENETPVTNNICTYINNSPVISMSRMFSYSKATTLDLSTLDTSNVKNMESMFAHIQATTLNLSNFDTSNVTDMSLMFYDTKVATLDLSSFDTSMVTDMRAMFSNTLVDEIEGLKNFDTSKVTNMAEMFSSSQAIIIDVSNFNTENVTDMNHMFFGSQATTLNLSNFNTSNVTNMSYMFRNSQVTTLDLSNFDTSNVTNMSAMFFESIALKTIYAGEKFNVNKVQKIDNDMFGNCTSLVGGAGTKYNMNYIGTSYAHIDKGPSNPGYFTKYSEFENDTWETIIMAVKNNNTSKYKLGDTKKVDLGDYGTHILRIANTSTPSECSTEGFSQTACGFVLEFADIITKHNMNDTATNIGGWPATSMRTFVKNDIYNAIPEELKNAIIDTTVVSGYGSGNTENFTSLDKLYLLAPKEIYTDFSNSYDTANDLTRTLDYYTNMAVTTISYNNAIKYSESLNTSQIGGTIIGDSWWLRTASYNNKTMFNMIDSYGAYAVGSGNSLSGARSSEGVSPAFRLG